MRDFWEKNIHINLNKAEKFLIWLISFLFCLFFFLRNYFESWAGSCLYLSCVYNWFRITDFYLNPEENMSLSLLQLLSPGLNVYYWCIVLEITNTSTKKLLLEVETANNKGCIVWLQSGIKKKTIRPTFYTNRLCGPFKFRTLGQNTQPAYSANYSI